LGLFSPRLVDDEVADWQFENYEWLIRNFSRETALQDSELWLPIAEHFSPNNKSGQPLAGRVLAKFLFKTVKIQCGFSVNDEFRLIPTIESKPQSLGGVAMVQTHEDGACGRYMIDKNEDGSYSETITYDSDLEDNPNQLVATFAHEISHALHNRSKEPLDIEPQLYELLTDLTAVYLGYGVFIANSRFSFSQMSSHDVQGWQASGAGYLPEADIIFATAIFMAIKNIPYETAASHLKPNLRKMLKKANKQLSKYQDEIDELRALAPLP